MKRIKLFAAALCIALLSACSQIDTGNVGVESTVGQVKPEELSPGVYFTLFKRVTEVSAKESLLSMNDMKPQTSDKITLTDLDVDLYVQIAPDKASDIMTRFAGDAGQLKEEDGVRVGFNYVTRQAREAIYNATSKFGSATIHTERSALSADIVKSLQADLNASAPGWFFVRSANVRNLVTDPALEANIKLAANRQFEISAKQKEIELATLEAQRKEIEARGEAKAVSLRVASIAVSGGKEYVELKAIEKWNGVMPATIAGGATPFVNVGK